MKLLAALLLLSLSMPLYAVEYPSTWPTTLADTYVDYSPNRITVAWPTTTGKFYCSTGTLAQVAGITALLMRPLSGESFLSSDYLTRNQEKIIVRAWSSDDRIACEQARLSLAGEWIVDRYSDNLTRPVYVIMDNFPSVKVKAGNVDYGVVCGRKIAPYSARITKYEWREVTLSNGLIGASVCRKK